MVYSIDIRTVRRCDFIDIADKIGKIVRDARVNRGLCFVFVPHTTAGLTINENADPSVVKDIMSTLDTLVPQSRRYTHAEGNSDAHIKSSILGVEKTIFIEDGCLKLGTWQGIFFCEFDGPRKRKVWVTIKNL
jgi:secondary thiamine-phosphate synthase enzyme